MNIVRVFTSGREYARVSVYVYVRIRTAAATLLNTWKKEEGRKEKRKEEGKEKIRRNQSSRRRAVKEEEKEGKIKEKNSQLDWWK